MNGVDSGGELSTEELTRIIAEVRERVRAHHPVGEAGQSSVPLADLMALVHARDAAEAKVAAIGTVNPRRPGCLNDLIQAGKRAVARGLDWFVREQVEFNRATIEAINTTMEALNDINRAIAQLAVLQDKLRKHVAETIEGPLAHELRELKDIRSHWHEWRKGWEENLSRNEIQFLRGLADLRVAYDQRLSHIEANFQELGRAQHRDFDSALRAQHQEFDLALRTQHQDFGVALEKSALEIQKKVWADLERIREEYERLIHNELRVLRQRARAMASEVQPTAPGPGAAGSTSPPLDYLRFAERFRGSEEHVRQQQQFYVERFRSCESVLDVGCGRGEFLEALREAGVAARGIDQSPELVAICRNKGLTAEEADLFAYLDAVDAGSLDGIFCAQVVEHLPPERLPDFVRLAFHALRRGGLIAIETPNPECLAIFATHFYIDPTHTRPVPASLLSFYLEEAGFGRIEVHQLSSAAESIPALGELPAGFRDTFFGGLDYAVVARRL